MFQGLVLVLGGRRGWEVNFLLTAITDQGCARAGSRVVWAGLGSQEGRYNLVV